MKSLSLSSQLISPTNQFPLGFNVNIFLVSKRFCLLFRASVMKFLSIIVCFVLFVQLCVAQRRQGTVKVKGDFMDVPVRAGYRISGNDGDLFLEDGILVKDKGTGYIDQRFRNRDPYRASAAQIVYGRPVWMRQ